MSDVAEQGGKAVEKQPSNSGEGEDAKSAGSGRKSQDGSKQVSRQGSAQSVRSMKSSSTKVILLILLLLLLLLLLLW